MYFIYGRRREALQRKPFRALQRSEERSLCVWDALDNFSHIQDPEIPIMSVGQTLCEITCLYALPSALSTLTITRSSVLNKPFLYSATIFCSNTRKFSCCGLVNAARCIGGKLPRADARVRQPNPGKQAGTHWPMLLHLQLCTCKDKVLFSLRHTGPI